MAPQAGYDRRKNKTGRSVALPSCFQSFILLVHASSGKECRRYGLVSSGGSSLLFLRHDLIQLQA